MAVMRATRTLRAAPGGVSTNVIAMVGTKVRVVDDSQLGWWKVELLDRPEKPQGFVSSDAVDKNADTVGPMDKLVFVRECCRQALTFGVSAHYLASVALLRTNITDGANGADYGPFALAPEEWSHYGTMPSFGIDLTPQDRTSWRLQCLLFAVMTNFNQRALATLIGSQPTPVELCFAQIVGTKAASAGLHDTTQAVDALVAGISDADAASDGIPRARIVARYPKYTQGLSVLAALDALAKDLQAAADVTRQLVVQAGGEFIDSVKDPVGSNATGNIDARINLDSPKIPAGRKNMANLIVTSFAAADYGVLQQIAALANAIAESKLNPKAKSAGTERSYGLFQLNLKGVGAGHDPEELTDPERNIAIMLDHISKQGRAREDFKITASLREAVAIFVRSFEKPAATAKAISTRFEIAQSLLA